MITPGTLFIVATPIGNLRDITLRALDVLREAHVIAAEDTRRTRKLLTAHGITSTVVSLHANSPVEKIDRLISRAMEGESVAFVTDAGSPAVSDPGVLLVEKAHEAGLPIRVVPGPSAVTAALGVAGLPCHDLRFLGFLPRHKSRRLAVMGDALRCGSTIILFEAPSRLRALLEDTAELAPDRRIAVCRELTKIHEEVLRGTSAELLERLPLRPKGEVTVVIAPGGTQEAAPASIDELEDQARRLRRSGLSTREIARILSTEHGIPQREAYGVVVRLSGTPVPSGRETSSAGAPESVSRSGMSSSGSSDSMSSSPRRR
jgi:16S rRNA (cytidine1402-2'-O)-methyltransferase